jgi:hypothetical protein
MSSTRDPLNVFTNPVHRSRTNQVQPLPAQEPHSGAGEGSSATAPHLPFAPGAPVVQPLSLATLSHERTVIGHDPTFVRQGDSSGRRSFALARRQPTSLSEDRQQALTREFLRPENQGKFLAFRLKTDPETFKLAIDMGETTSTPKQWVFLIEGTWASPITQEAYLPEEIFGEIIRPSRGSAMTPPPPPARGEPTLAKTLESYSSSQPRGTGPRVRLGTVQNGRPIKGQRLPELEMTTRGMAEAGNPHLDLESPTAPQAIAGLEAIVLEVAHTPTEQVRQAEAERDAARQAERQERQKGAGELLLRAACGTPCRKTGFVVLLALILGGLGVAGFYIYRRLNPSCREDFSLTQRGSNAVSGPLNLWFGASSEAGILVSFACLVLTAAKFRTHAPEVTLTGTQMNGSHYEEILDASVMTPQQNGLLLNIRRLEEMPCGTEESALLSIKAVDDRENIHRASLPLRLQGQGTPFAILNANDSRTLSVRAGIPFSPFAGLRPVVCFGDHPLEVNFSTALTGSQRFPSGYSALTPTTFTGNASEAFRFIAQHQGQVNANELYSGDGSYYLGGLTLTDLSTNQTMTTARVILAVSNPFLSTSFSGPTDVSLTPGVAERAFAGQQYQGNRYDLAQMQVSMNQVGLTLRPALNVIETGNTGFVCIGTLPYCMDYLSSTTFTLGVGPSGTWSYAHSQITTRTLLSPLPADPTRELQFSACNPVVPVTPVWTRPARVMQSFFFYPAQEFGFNTTLDPKDGLRTDILGYVSLFEASRSQVWFEGEAVGSLSSVMGFIRNTSIQIPMTWEPGTESLFNFTVCTGFNATNCQGQRISSTCTTRIIPHEVIDFPERIDLPQGAFAFLTPGELIRFDDYFVPVEENLAQAHHLGLACEEDPASVPPGYEGLCFSPLGVLFLDPNSRSFREEDARQMLHHLTFSAPDYASIDPSANQVLSGCRAVCNATYGNASASLTFQRRGNQRRLVENQALLNPTDPI